MTPALSVSSGDINVQIEKICSSPELNTKLQLCKLLRYLSNETIEGREENLKGFTIGLEVFKKENDFDPEQDPIVRIHAGRLRRMLKLYYLGTGKDDNVIIDIPKGRYIPTFFYNNLQISDPDSRDPVQNSLSNKPSIAVLPFKNLSNNPDHEYLAIGFAEELSVELTKLDDIIVYGSVPFADATLSEKEKKDFIKNRKIHFSIEGGIHYYNDQIKVLVKLIDTNKSEQIWAERYKQNINPENLLEIEENIVREITSVVGSEYGIILQRLTKDTKNSNLKNPTIYDAILRFHYFLTNQSPEIASSTFDALHKAMKADPGSAIVIAFLASMNCNRYLLDFPNYNNAYDQTGILANEAYKLNPNSLTVKIALAYKHFAYNEKDSFFHMADQCLKMKPNSSTRLGALGQFIALYGDWEHGKAILDKAMNMNVSYPLSLHGTTTLFYYRNENYDKALFEAKQYKMPALFWPHMLRAAVLGQMKRKSEALTHINQLKQLKPAFEEKAFNLISRYVKEEELVEHVMEGLKKAGLEM